MRFSRLNQTTNNEREAKKRKHGWIAAAAQRSTTQRNTKSVQSLDSFSPNKKEIYINIKINIIKFVLLSQSNFIAFN